MKNNNNLIEFINQYLNKELSKENKQLFENKLKTDHEFYEIYQEQLIFIEGLKRSQLISEIKAGKEYYVKVKWLKIISLSVFIGLLLVASYSLFFNSVLMNKNPGLPRINTSILTKDSVAKKYTVIWKTDSIVKDQEKTKPFGIQYYKKKPQVIYSGLLSLNEFKIKFPNSKHLKAVNDTIIIYDKISTSTLNEYNQLAQNSFKNSEINNKTLTQEREAMEAFYHNITKKPQVIQLNNDKDTAFICNEGTKLILKAKSFIDPQTNLPISGNITLEISEYYKLSDMLLAKLSTKSNNKILETGGMINIKAYKKGKPITLKEDKKITIGFPKTKNKKGMQLFSGQKNKNGINWNLTAEQKKDSSLVVSPFEGIVEVPLAVVQTAPVFPGCESKTGKDAKRCLNEQLKNFFSEKFNQNMAKNLKLKGKQKINISFKIDINGNIIEAIAKASHIKLAQEAIRVIDLLPKLIAGKQKNKPVIVSNYLLYSFKLDGPTKKSPEIFQAKSYKVLKETIETKGIENISPKTIGYYVFSSSSLGWINCDRFFEMKNTSPYNLEFKTHEAISINLIFKSMNTILQSKNRNNSCDFGFIPNKKEDVVLVAIKIKNNTLFIGTQHRNTENKSELMFNYKAVSVAELKHELSQLDPLFL